MKFLDNSGVTTLWNKIKGAFLSLNGGTVNDTFEISGKKIVVSTKSYSFSNISPGVNIHANTVIDGNFTATGTIIFINNNKQMLRILENSITQNNTTFVGSVNFGSNDNIKISIESDGTGKLYRGTNNMYIGTDRDAGYLYLAGSVAGYDNINCSSLTEDGAIAWKLLENSEFELGNSATDGDFYIWYNGKRYTFDIASLVSQGILKEG